VFSLRAHTPTFIKLLVARADRAEEAYRWQQPYLGLIRWWYYDYIYENRREAWRIESVRVLDNHMYFICSVHGVLFA